MRRLVGADDLRAADPDRARQPGALRVVQAEHRHRRDALAGAGLAHDAEGLARARRCSDRSVTAWTRPSWVGNWTDEVLDDEERVVVRPVPPVERSGSPTLGRGSVAGHASLTLGSMKL